MNTEMFSKIKVYDENHVRTAIIADSYQGGYKLNDESWLIGKQSKYFNRNKPIQEFAFALDNAKFWILTFVYKFLLQCLDPSRFRITSSDTDSIYIAVVGDN